MSEEELIAAFLEGDRLEQEGEALMHKGNGIKSRAMAALRKFNAGPKEHQ